MASKLKKKSVAVAIDNGNSNGSFSASPRERMRDICKVLRSLVGGVNVKSVKISNISIQARPYVGLDSQLPRKFRLKQFTPTTVIVPEVDTIDKDKIDELLAVSSKEMEAADRGRFVSFVPQKANQSSPKTIPPQKGGNRRWSTNRANFVNGNGGSENKGKNKSKKKSENTRSGNYIASPSGVCKIRVPIYTSDQPSLSSDEKKEKTENNENSQFKVPKTLSFRYVACNPPRQFCTQCQKLNDLDEVDCQYCATPLAEIMPLRKFKSKSAAEILPTELTLPTSQETTPVTLVVDDDDENEDIEDEEKDVASEVGAIEFSHGLGGGKYTKLTAKID